LFVFGFLELFLVFLGYIFLSEEKGHFVLFFSQIRSISSDKRGKKVCLYSDTFNFFLFFASFFSFFLFNFFLHLGLT